MVAADDFADEVANLKGPLWLEFEFRLAFRRIEGQPLQLRYKSPKDAWAILAGFIADGKVRARATAVDRYLSGSEGPVPQVPSALPPEVADHLVLWDLPNGANWLAPRDQAFEAGVGRFWKDVTINWHDLLRALGDTDKPKSGGRPTDYDWPAIEDAAYAHFDVHGGRRAGRGLQTDIEEYMKHFAEKRHGRSPTESLTREHAKNVIKRLKERAEN